MGGLQVNPLELRKNTKKLPKPKRLSGVVSLRSQSAIRIFSSDN
jgi:hypothetical protein